MLAGCPTWIVAICNGPGNRCGDLPPRLRGEGVTVAFASEDEAFPEQDSVLLMKNAAVFTAFARWVSGDRVEFV